MNYHEDIGEYQWILYKDQQEAGFLSLFPQRLKTLPSPLNDLQ